ncbi:MAG TPA: WYL domain-containing protein [Acidimicrobiales bacterium]|nr:WYL domain-containing protein [Acidimicrobiales bacterium]
MASSAKLERLLNLTAALLETPRPLTADEIADRIFGYPEDKVAFRRAFERDKDALREMGIPIVMTELTGADPPQTGYRIPKDQYYIRDPGLEPDELAALHLAASAIRLEGVEGTAGLWKLGGVVPQTTSSAPATVAAIPVDDRLVELFGAVGDRRQVTFTYRDEQRAVDPYRLDFHRGRWYVTGYDHGRADERVFRLDRIGGEVEAGTARSFEPPSVAVPGARAEPWQLGEGEPVRARVLVEADQAAIAIGIVGPEAVAEQRSDGSIVVELPVSNPDGFRAFVVGFLDHAEVLGPAELRGDLVDWLRAIADNGPPS